MLEVGNGGMSNNEYRSHFSLWAMMASPLIAGNDVANMSADTKAILLNKDVIAVDQDKLGRQGRRIAKDGNGEVWVRTLADGKRAALLFNRGETPVKLTVNWAQLDYPASQSLKLRNLWTHRDLGAMKGSYSAKVEPHDVVMVTLTP
jgi:alpha-galactosidase